MIPETILGQSVALHRIQCSDADEVAAAVRESLGEISPWMPWACDGYNAQLALEFIEPRMAMWEERRECIFAIRDLNARFIGTCGLHDIHTERRSASLGYWLRTSATGNGYATEAVQLLSSYAIEHLDMVRVEIIVDVANQRSQRVAIRAGATREGVLANRLIIRKELRPAVMYSITPNENR